MSRPSEPLELISKNPAAKLETTALLEAYKKHTEELRRIEDRQHQIVALVIGIFSAAATLLTKGWVPDSLLVVAYLSMVALAIGWLGFHSINELHDLRIAVRELLVRCEIGLGFYKLGAFLEERMLYTEYELHYQKRGKWLRLEHWIVAMICLTFVALLWIEYSKSNSANQNPRARITDCSIERDVLFLFSQVLLSVRAN
jgi:hypothetical protein